jgi:hypothetical protein
MGNYNNNSTDFMGRQGGNSNNNNLLSLPEYGINLEKKLRQAEDKTSRDRRQAATHQGDYHNLPRGVRREPQGIEFESLLRSSEQLLNDQDLPVNPLKRALVDTNLATSKFVTEQRTRTFLDQTLGDATTTTSRSIQQDNNRAKKLLSTYGMDVERHEQAHNLISLQPTRTVQNIDGVGVGLSNTDVQGYLQQYQNAIVTTAIRESLRQTESEAKQRVTNDLDDEWRKMRKAIQTKGHLKSANGGGGRSTRNSPMHHLGKGGYGTKTIGDEDDYSKSSGIDSTGPLHVNPDQRSQMIRYAEVLRHYHSKSNTGDAYNIAEQFEKAVSLCDELDPEIKQNRAHSWELLSFYMGEKEHHNGNARNCFHNDYKNNSKQLRQDFAKRSVKFLQNQFYNVKIAQRLANNQGMLNSIKPINQKGRNNTANIDEIVQLVENQSNTSGNNTEELVWKKIYHCLRCGKDIKDFFSSIKATKLRRPIESALNHINKSLNSGDVGQNNMIPQWAYDLQSIARDISQKQSYKYAVVKLLSQCGGCLNSQSGVKRLESLRIEHFQVQDYMWQHILVSISTASLTENQQYNIIDLAKTIRRFGPHHFSPNNERPLLYFQVSFAYILNFCVVLT